MKVLLLVQLPPTLMAWTWPATETRAPPPEVPTLMVRLPVTVNVWAVLLLPAPLLPRFTVVVPVVWVVEPTFSVAAVVVSAKPAVEWPMPMVLLSPAPSVVPRFKVLKVVPEDPVIAAASVPAKVTVPLPCVKVLLLVQLPPQVIDAVPLAKARVAPARMFMPFVPDDPRRFTTAVLTVVRL